MALILNLTGSKIAPEQAAAGVFDPPAQERSRLRRLLESDACASGKDLDARAARRGRLP